MAIVRFVFAALRPGVDAADYERFEREVDYAVSEKIKPSSAIGPTASPKPALGFRADRGTMSSGSKSPIAPLTKRSSRSPARNC